MQRMPVAMPYIPGGSGGCCGNSQPPPPSLQRVRAAAWGLHPGRGDTGGQGWPGPAKSTSRGTGPCAVTLAKAELGGVAGCSAGWVEGHRPAALSRPRFFAVHPGAAEIEEFGAVWELLGPCFVVHDVGQRFWG